MNWLVSADWTDLFIPTHSIAEMIVRGTLMYVALFLIFRFVMRRQTGSVGIADILVVVVLADAAQNAFSNEYRSFTEGVVLVLTIVFWNILIDWLGFHVPAIGRVLQEPPLPLVTDGRVIRRNLRRELMTMDELDAVLRKNGIDDVSKVRFAAMESDGEISVIPFEEKGAGSKGGRGKSRDPAGGD